MTGAIHARAPGQNTAQTQRRIAGLANAEWRPFLCLHTLPMARAAHLVAAIRRRPAVQTHLLVVVVTDALRLTVCHYAAPQPSTVHREAVRHTREPNVVVAALAVARGTVVGGHNAFTMTGTSLVFARVGLAATVSGAPRAAGDGYGNDDELSDHVSSIGPRDQKLNSMRLKPENANNPLSLALPAHRGGDL